MAKKRRENRKPDNSSARQAKDLDSGAEPASEVEQPGVNDDFERESNERIIAAAYQSKTFLGPLPPPESLEHYEKIHEGAANRIIKMAEKQASHRQDLEKYALRREYNEALIGQIFGLVIGITALLCGTYTAVNGFPFAGGVIGVGGVAGLVTAFIYGRQGNSNQDDDSDGS